MVGLKLNHVSKRGHRSDINNTMWNIISIAILSHEVVEVYRDKRMKKKIPSSVWSTGFRETRLNQHIATTSLKRKCCHFDEIFITDCTESCQNDNFQCSQWWSFRQSDDIFVSVLWWTPGAWINTKMSSYQYRKSHCGDKTVVRSSYLHDGISYTGKMASLY